MTPVEDVVYFKDPMGAAESTYSCRSGNTFNDVVLGEPFMVHCLPRADSQPAESPARGPTAEKLQHSTLSADKEKPQRQISEKFQVRL